MSSSGGNGSKSSERRDSSKEATRREGSKYHHHKSSNRSDGSASGSSHNHRSEKVSSKSGGSSSSVTVTSSTQSTVSSAEKSSSGKHVDNHVIEKQQAYFLEERRKEIMLSSEDHLHSGPGGVGGPINSSGASNMAGSGGVSHHHKRKERYHDKHKSKKNRDPSRDKENALSTNFPADSYGENRSTSDEEEQNRIRYKKERKELQEYAKQRHHSSSGGSAGIGLHGVDYKLAVSKLNCGSSGIARDDRKSSQPVSRAESSAEEGREKKKCRSNSSRKANSSDTDDSDEPKKHSIFDIPDDGPNISMYDKVKARSCKNMQKQEEEKKIKAKFSQLKQCRAKREGKNRSKSWEEGDDSDSDAMHSDTTINSKYNHKDHNKSGMVTTTDDEDHAPTTPRSRRNFKDSSLASDSDEGHRHPHQHRTAMFNRDRLNDLCDDESSEGGGHLMLSSAGGEGRDKPNREAQQHQKQQDYHEKKLRRSSGEDKKSSRKNSRSTRIQSDTETDEDSMMRERSKPKGSGICRLENNTISDAEYNHINDNIGRMFGSTDTNEQQSRIVDRQEDVKIKQEVKSEDECALDGDKKSATVLPLSSSAKPNDSVSTVPVGVEHKPSTFALIASDISDDDLVKTVVKSEYTQHDSIAGSNTLMPTAPVITSIKREPTDNLSSYKSSLSNIKERQQQHLCNLSGSDGADLLPEKSSKSETSQNESKKKHKKKQKRNKTLEGSSTYDQLEKDVPTTPRPVEAHSVDTEPDESAALATVTLAVGADNANSESKKQSSEDHHSLSYNKKKHSSGKKDKRRDRSKEDHDKSTSSTSSRSKKSKNRHKEGSAASGSGVPNSGSGNGSGSANSKFLDMELFGPISDEESQHSSVETEASHGKQGSVEPDESKEEDMQPQLSEQKEKTGAASGDRMPTDFTGGNEENQQNISSKQEIATAPVSLSAASYDPLNDRESRKRSKEKKRRDREKLRASMVLLKEDENSVDLDEAGRALEAQLMSDNDQKVEEVSPASTIASASLSGKRSSVEVLDVFRYTDGDDSMEMSYGEKKEAPSASATDHSRKEKKKKKKRGKEEKHKHHHSSGSSLGTTATTTSNAAASNVSSVNSNPSSGTVVMPSTDASGNVAQDAFGGNANNSKYVNSHPQPQPPTTTPVTPSINKLSLDIISAQQEDLKHNLSKPSPSLPCLLDESPPPSNKQQLTAQMNTCEPTGKEGTEEGVQSSIPLPGRAGEKEVIACSTPAYKIEEASSVQKSQQDSALRGTKQKTAEQLEKTQPFSTPSFGYGLEEQLHEKAVMSISGEFTEKSSKPDKEPAIEGKEVELKHADKQKADEKLLLVEEKSRVVISQEETEDAVAALLGESFGTSNTPDFSDMYNDPVEEEQLSSQLAVEEPPQIPEEDDEEMKKAIMSLNAEELDIKEADTPQSEHDLQIDTDTEDANLEDDQQSSLLRFDNPPKTPDVDLSQLGKPLIEGSQLTKAGQSPTAIATENSSNTDGNAAKKDDSSSKLEMPDTPGKNVAMASDSPARVTPDVNPAQHPAKHSVRSATVSVTVVESTKQSEISDNGSSNNNNNNNIYYYIKQIANSNCRITIYSNESACSEVIAIHYQHMPKLKIKQYWAAVSTAPSPS
uniref:SPOC domain-containing protein n=1 Tax=Anopheles merus TaxID=30066 RepID=A0A182VD88_ANOME